MKLNSQFFFTGASILTLVAFITATWTLLIAPVFLVFCALACADGEQQRDLPEDTNAAAMFLARTAKPLLPLDYFSTRDFLGYRAGYPVYRILISARGIQWQLLAAEDDLDSIPHDTIRVFPGLIYQQKRDA